VLRELSCEVVAVEAEVRGGASARAPVLLFSLAELPHDATSFAAIDVLTRMPRRRWRSS